MLEDNTVDELLEIATDLDITGRHDMRKDELIEAIEEAEEATETPRGNSAEDGAQQPEEEDGDQESDEQQQETDDEPLSEDELPWDVADVQEGDAAMMNHLSLPLAVKEVQPGNPYEVVMQTNRGGKHKLTIPRDGDARLMRWRAGDEEWMYNAEYPTEFQLADNHEFTFAAEATLPTRVAESEDEAREIAIMRVDAGELEVEVADVERDDETWTVTLRGSVTKQGFNLTEDSVDTGDFR